MNKLYRFMMEYANYQKRKVEESELPRKDKDSLLMHIDRTVKDYLRGFNTVHDTMTIINDVDFDIRFGLSQYE